jgi:hypothetical protein
MKRRKRIDPETEIGFAAIARQYLPGASDLIDRLTIVLQKEVRLTDHRTEYRNEREAIVHDLELLVRSLPPTAVAKLIDAVCALQFANCWIWENEMRIRDGSSTLSAERQLSLLRATHAVNGVRNTAKNIIAALLGGRKDYKIDALAENLSPEHGNWRIFEEIIEQVGADG